MKRENAIGESFASLFYFLFSILVTGCTTGFLLLVLLVSKSLYMHQPVDFLGYGLVGFALLTLGVLCSFILKRIP